MKRANSNKANRTISQRWLLAALAVLMLAAVTMVFLFLNREARLPLDGATYQYFMAQRVSYGEDTVVLSGDYNVIFEEDGRQSDGGVTPIYYEDTTAMVLPETMSWIDPTGGLEWRVPALSTITMDENGLLWCDTGSKRVQMDGGVLTDCQGTYVFLDTVTITLNGAEQRLPAFSFYSTGEGLIRLYHYGTGELTQVGQLYANTVVTAVRGYQVDLTAGIYTSSGGVSRLLVSTPSVLTEITRR